MKSKSSEKAVIIGAGPAGLTAAYELLTRSKIVPIVLEKSEYMGGSRELSSITATASISGDIASSPKAIA
jgi:protoporphyrinogen oxidase